MSKRGIILATFGSIYGEAVEKSVGMMEQRIRQEYPGSAVKRVFLADALVEKWNEKYERKVSSLMEAVSEMREQKVTELYIQPFTLVPDQCYLQLRKQIMKLIHTHEGSFKHISIGKPLLTSLGVKNYADDYEAMLESISRHINVKQINKSVLLMANGQNQLEYSTLQLKAMYGQHPNMVVFTANGFPTFKQSLTMLDGLGNKDVLVVPLALIGSSHLMDYLGGERSDSIYALLAEAGYEADIWTEGLGENPYIQEMFLKQLSQAVRLYERKQETSTMAENADNLEKRRVTSA